MGKPASRFVAQVSFVLVALAVTGWGCVNPIGKLATVFSGPTTSTFKGVSAHDAAQKINLVPGSVIEMRQTFLGFGAKLAAALAGENKEDVRVIVVDRFAPMNVADASWKLSTKVEADSSVKAREDARKQGKTEPEPVMVDKASEGTIQGFNLKDGHSLYLPAFWPESATATSLGATGIWLSDDQFQSLSRNRVATLDFGLLDATFNNAVAKISDFKDAFAKLEGQADAVGNRTDVFKLDGDKDPVEWPLTVNGQDVKVEVLKAHTWFGEIVVLNNRQNPLVLKATLNPLTAGAADAFTNLGALKALVGYEVTELKDVQE